MKVSLVPCVCWAMASALTGCGGDDPLLEADPAAAADPEAEHPRPSDSSAAAAERTTLSDCPDLGDQPVGCGQISIRLKGVGSSCQLMPTASDLTRPARSVYFDCTPLARGPNGYDYDETGHITLTGDTCEALQAGGPHRVSLLLACGPSER